VNDAPVAGDDTVTVDEGAGATALDLLGNDTDAEGDDLAIDAAGPAGHGTVQLAGGTVTYRPAAGFAGADAFSYTLSDGHGGTDLASVTVTVRRDTTRPTVSTGPVEVAGSTIGTSSLRLRYRWRASDAGSGVASQVVQRRLGTAAWHVLARPTAGDASLVGTTVPGRAESWRVQATDRRGNASSWAAWATVTARMRQETSSAIAWTGSWRR
jgi:hypothetical protein